MANAIRAVSSLQARLRLGLGAQAALLLLVSVVALGALTRLGGVVGTILQENYGSVVSATAMNESLERLDSAALFASTGQGALARPMLTRHRELFSRALEREAHNVTLPGEDELVRRVQRDFADYVATTDRVLATADGRDTGRYFAELLPRFDRLRADVQAIRLLNQGAMEAADGRARQMAHNASRAAALAVAAALLLALWIAWWLRRAVVQPVAVLRDGAVRIGEGLVSGELPAPVAVPPLVELAPLAEALNALLTRLRIYRDSSLGELLAAQDLARSTIACLLDPVIVVDPTGAILLANEAAEGAFGLREGTADELRRAALALPGPLLEAVEAVQRSQQPVLPSSLAQSMRHPSATGGERFFLVRAAPLVDRGPDRGRVLVVAQDVTRFRRIDELKSNVVATVSHEFKTPLTSLRMATHLLLEPAIGPLSADQRELVTTACDDTERLRLLVDKFLDLTRIEAEAGEMIRAPVVLSRLLTAVAEAHRTLAASRSITLAVEAPDDLPDALLDADKMTMALSNLVANALQHTAAGGHVTLEAHRTGERLQLVVRDDGEGIQPDDLPHIFDRFRRGSDVVEDRHRLGLGLAIAREVTLQHGGELIVASERGRGATFIVALPPG